MLQLRRFGSRAFTTPRDSPEFSAAFRFASTAPGRAQLENQLLGDATKATPAPWSVMGKSKALQILRPAAPWARRITQSPDSAREALSSKSGTEHRLLAGISTNRRTRREGHIVRKLPPIVVF
ncbi:hypothetical protein CMUS01_15280 [Colletotrichum musicola]|uniref:Uncharacterized protein n=1 Tax=Colletotrichum musicola TaxID=2175873 RepID=A0A8H6IXH8_9PEZI|nr:hypothetical protein CMUS01_15280 [Colletotrichum musicola]